MTPPHVLLIDNHDSFVFNLAESFQRLGAEIVVYRNTVSAQSALSIAQQHNSLIVLSPGPGRPEEAGCCLPLISAAKGSIPVLGVCLGHQAIAAESGASVVAANRIVHGKASPLDHNGEALLTGVPSPLAVARYHSLCVRDLPSRFSVQGRLDGMVMAMADVTQQQYGLQFHPESILTTAGDILLKNALSLLKPGQAVSQENAE